MEGLPGVSGGACGGSGDDVHVAVPSAWALWPCATSGWKSPRGRRGGSPPRCRARGRRRTPGGAPGRPSRVGEGPFLSEPEKKMWRKFNFACLTRTRLRAPQARETDFAATVKGAKCHFVHCVLPGDGRKDANIAKDEAGMRHVLSMHACSFQWPFMRAGNLTDSPSAYGFFPQRCPRLQCDPAEQLHIRHASPLTLPALPPTRPHAHQRAPPAH